MKTIKQGLRLFYIHWVLARNGLDQVIVSFRWFAPIKFIVYLNPWNWFRKDLLSRGEVLRKICEDLGPLFVKFGQALSTRPDLLPPDIAMELCKLQDKVPPFPYQQVVKILEKTFGSSPSNLFKTFDPEPLASASMAQVHAATLMSGEDVVVKVLRPNIQIIIQQDLRLLETMASLFETYWPESRRFKPKEIVAEFAQSLMHELDLQCEAGNASQLRRNFKDSPLLYVPAIHWEYVRANVLVMERIYGIPVADIAKLKSSGVDLKKLAERGVEIFFTQVFRDCFFHADMHPGNIFVSTETPLSPRYLCVDFGIMGSLNAYDKRYLAENLLAFFNRDYQRVAQLHVESGWVSRNTRIDEFQSAIRTVCEPIFEQPLKNISFALVVLRLFQVARRFHMEVQPQLILLQKTLFAIEGLGRQIDPELDLWTTAKPFLERWMREQMGPKALWSHIKENIPFFIEQLPYMPRLAHDVLLLTQEERRLNIENIHAAQKNQHKRKSNNSGFYLGLLTSLVILFGLKIIGGITIP